MANLLRILTFFQVRWVQRWWRGVDKERLTYSVFFFLSPCREDMIEHGRRLYWNKRAIALVKRLYAKRKKKQQVFNSIISSAYTCTRIPNCFSQLRKNPNYAFPLQHAQSRNFYPVTRAAHRKKKKSNEPRDKHLSFALYIYSRFLFHSRQYTLSITAHRK